MGGPSDVRESRRFAPCTRRAYTRRRKEGPLACALTKRFRERALRIRGRALFLASPAAMYASEAAAHLSSPPSERLAGQVRGHSGYARRHRLRRNNAYRRSFENFIARPRRGRCAHVSRGGPPLLTEEGRRELTTPSRRTQRSSPESLHDGRKETIWTWSSMTSSP
jgi:hypothetical protein